MPTEIRHASLESHPGATPDRRHFVMKSDPKADRALSSQPVRSCRTLS